MCLKSTEYINGEIKYFLLSIKGIYFLFNIYFKNLDSTIEKLYAIENFTQICTFICNINNIYIFFFNLSRSLIYLFIFCSRKAL